MAELKDIIKPIHIPDFHDFLFIKELPPGTLSSTSLLIHKESQQHFICKSFPKSIFGSPNKIDMLKERITKLRSLNFVCNYVDMLITDDSVYLIRPYLDLPNLSDFLILHRFDPNSIYDLWISIVKRFYLIHKAGVYPSAIKPSNIFITQDNRIILTDFYILPTSIGFMFKTFNPLEMQWLPPEYFNGSKSVPNASSDIWSLAALFITMNGMALPWASKNIFTMVRKMLNPSFEVLRDFNSSVLKIMTFSLQADQNKRLRLRQILLEPKPVNNVKRLSIRNWNTQNQINYSTNSLQKNLVPLNSKSKTKMCFRYRKHGCSCLASTRNLSLTKSATFMPIKQALSEPIIGSKKRNEKMWLKPDFDTQKNTNNKYHESF